LLIRRCTVTAGETPVFNIAQSVLKEASLTNKRDGEI